MTNIAFIFPGQGSQTVGMGVGLAENFDAARKAFDQASQVLNWDLLDACRMGPDERLRQTEVAQPALYVTGYAAFAVLGSFGIKPQAAAGHSIGEYAALAAAGVFGFTEGIDLVRQRGLLMKTAADAHPGGMLAILGMARDAVETLCRQIQEIHGTCVPVNFNSPEQIVVAGEEKALEALSAAASGSAKRIITLNVSGAFHSPLMKEAALQMKQCLSRIAFRDASFPVAMNVDGQCVQDARSVADALARQLDHSVEWVRSVESLRALGCTEFIECGSGRVLGGLLKRIDRAARAFSSETPEAIKEIVEYRHSKGNPPEALKA